MCEWKCLNETETTNRHIAVGTIFYCSSNINGSNRNVQSYIDCWRWTNEPIYYIIKMYFRKRMHSTFRTIYVCGTIVDIVNNTYMYLANLFIYSICCCCFVLNLSGADAKPIYGLRFVHLINVSIYKTNEVSGLHI